MDGKTPLMVPLEGNVTGHTLLLGWAGPTAARARGPHGAAGTAPGTSGCPSAWGAGQGSQAAPWGYEDHGVTHKCVSAYPLSLQAPEPSPSREQAEGLARPGGTPTDSGNSGGGRLHAALRPATGASGCSHSPSPVLHTQDTLLFTVWLHGSKPMAN